MSEAMKSWRGLSRVSRPKLHSPTVFVDPRWDQSNRGRFINHVGPGSGWELLPGAAEGLRKLCEGWLHADCGV